MPLFPPTRALVGRSADLHRLRSALTAGPGGLAVVAGDAGIGKSRLVAELASSLSDEGWSVVVGHGVGQAGTSLPYLPFVELLGEIDQAHPEVVDTVLTAHPVLAHLLPGRPMPPRPADVPAPASDPGRLAGAVHACLTAVGAATPLLAILEDMHWADNSTRDLLTVLLTRGFSAPVALVVTYRSDDLHRRHPLHETLGHWARVAGLTRVDLRGLGRADMTRLVRGLDGAPRDPLALATVVDRAEGNAFFAEQLVAGAADGSGFGDDLGRVLWLRVERLGEEARTLVRTMAVGGRRVRHDLLSAVVGLPPAAMDAAVREAVDHHLLQLEGADAYAFRHALLGESVYGDLLPGERARLHAAYAATLREHPELGPASALARHSARSGDLVTAVSAAVRAGAEALSVGGPADALTHFERALGWMPLDDPARDAITLSAARAASVAGNSVRAVELLRERVASAGPGQEPGARAELLAELAGAHRALDLPFDGLAMTREALSLLPVESRDARRARVLLAHLQALVDALEYAHVHDIVEEVTALADLLADPRLTSEARTILARVVEAEQDAAAMAVHLERVRADLAGGDDPIQVRVHHNLGSVYQRRGDLEAAVEVFDEGRRIAERLDRSWAPWGLECRTLAGIYSYELGWWERAEALLTPSDGPPPALGAATLESARLLLRVARGDDVDSECLDRLTAWWPWDGLVVVLTTVGGIEIHGARGDVDGLLALLATAVDNLDRKWGTYQALIRLVALAVGRCADALEAAPSGGDLGWARGAHDQLAPLYERAREVAADLDVGTTASGAPGAERRAWALRLEAEWLRFRRRYVGLGPGGDGGPSDPAASAQDLLSIDVEAWRRSVAGFATYPLPFEAARSRLHLATALRAAGDPAADEEARAALSQARALGAAPLAARIEMAFPSPSGVPSRAGASAADVGTVGQDAPSAGAPTPGSRRGQAPAGPSLTPREVEVLGLVALGRTNGQIGRELFISTKTVSVHVSNVLAKLGAGTRGEAAAFARDRGLI